MIHIYSPLTFSKKITLNHLDELYPESKSLRAKWRIPCLIDYIFQTCQTYSYNQVSQFFEILLLTYTHTHTHTHTHLIDLFL